MTGKDLGLPVQLRVIVIFYDHHMRHQSLGGHAAAGAKQKGKIWPMNEPAAREGCGF
jgi:hypothetical protein